MRDKGGPRTRAGTLTSSSAESASGSAPAISAERRLRWTTLPLDRLLAVRGAVGCLKRQHEKGEAMRLIDLLDRCLTLEKRAAAVYRTFGAAPGGEPHLWADLAADEEGLPHRCGRRHDRSHARSIREAHRSLAPDDRGTTVDGCEAALADVERRLAEAETLPAAAGQDRRLIAALNIELSEIEVLRQLAIRAVGRPRVPDQDHAHLRRLADAARRRSGSDRVRLAVALLLARERLAASSAAPTRW